MKSLRDDKFRKSDSRFLIAEQLDQAALREIAHEVRCAEGPGRAIGGRTHAIDDRAEFGRRHSNDIAGFMGKAFTRRIAVFDGRIHRARV